MYGIVIEGIRYMIEDHFGSATLALALERAHLPDATFSTHDRYSEKIIPNLLTAVSDITGNSMEELGMLAGRYFIRFMSKYAQELLKVLGRRFSDFLKGLDGLHEYFRFSYERIRPPSFYCDRETADGLTLHYRSRRRGYINYVIGQLMEIAKIYFDQEIVVEVVRKEEKKGFQYVLLRVAFDNRDYNTDQKLKDKNMALNEFLPVDPLSVMSMFPYFVTFDKKMEIVVVGKALNHIIPELVGKRIDEEFVLIRPCVKFTWDACLHHLNNLFELETTSPIFKETGNATITFAVNDAIEENVELPQRKLDENGDIAVVNGISNNGNEKVERQAGNYLHLKGPMVYLKQSELIIYLPTVLIEVLDNLFDMGLYINDYSSSDCNREIIMASAQRPDDLKELLKREKDKSRQLAKNMSEIDQARKTAREFLTHLVPREIANELLTTGKRSMAAAEQFDEVSLAFIRVFNFETLITSQPSGVITAALNKLMYTLDHVIIKHGLYKVETLLPSYFVSCGAPYPTQNHAEFMADALLEIIQSIKGSESSFVEGKNLSITIGMHAGAILACVTGQRVPKYCLVGDTVSCASQLEALNKQPMTILVSVKAKVLLENSSPGQFQFENRGKVSLKGKGDLLAFGLLSKKGPPRYNSHPPSNINMLNDDDDDSDVYTEIDDFNEVGRAASMSRMSISIAGSRCTSSASGAVDANGDEIERQSRPSTAKSSKGRRLPTPPISSVPPPQPPAGVPSEHRRRKPPAAAADANGAAAENGQATAGDSEQKRTKGASKERRSKK